MFGILPFVSYNLRSIEAGSAEPQSARPLCGRFGQRRSLGCYLVWFLGGANPLQQLGYVDPTSPGAPAWGYVAAGSARRLMTSSIRPWTELGTGRASLSGPARS